LIENGETVARLLVATADATSTGMECPDSGYQILMMAMGGMPVRNVLLDYRFLAFFQKIHLISISYRQTNIYVILQRRYPNPLPDFEPLLGFT
jgi:hypothetical protein